jgi:dTDP-4-dehydrorhamnose 3,5-epimerase
MNIEKLSISGSYLISNDMYPDSRGNFFEWFNQDSIVRMNIFFGVAQANFSTSKKGVVRGLHYSLAPKGQSKIVMCSSGLINDVIVDLRIGSPTFRATQNVTLSPDSGKVVFIPTGVGHGFSVLSDTASLTYLLSSEYSPSDEHTIKPLDESLAINWHLPLDTKPIMSERDESAISFDQALKQNLLSKYENGH